MLRPVSRWAAGGQVAASSVGESLPTSSVGGEMRGAVPRRAEGPLSQLLGVAPCVWRRDRPILDRGCGLLSRDGYAAMPFDWRGSSVGGPRTAPGRGPAA